MTKNRVSICWACGKRRETNESGFCEKCWVKYAHLRIGGKE